MINTKMMNQNNKPFKAPQNLKKAFNLSTKPDKNFSLMTSKINSKIGTTAHSTCRHYLSSSTSSSNASSISNSSKNDLLNKNRINQPNLTGSHSKSSISNQTNPVDTNYPCQLCELNFYNIDRLTFHLVKIHKLDKRINLVQCYVDGCEQKFRKRMELVDHLNDFHNLGVVVIRKTVNNLDEFTKWKEKIEKETGFVWIQNNKFFLNHRLRKTYICNRPATNGSKIYSLHGLTTINNHSTFCLSSIKITENEDNTFFVEFIETHNHDTE